MNPHDCKGCRTYLSYPCHILSIIIEERIELPCPCVECIIKPMCLTACGDFDKYEELIRAYD